MEIIFWLLAFLFTSGVVAYNRASRHVASAAMLTFFAFFFTLSTLYFFFKLIVTITAIAAILIINVQSIRRKLLIEPIMRVFKKLAPPMSETERAALDAGDVAFEADLFSGSPDWEKIRSLSALSLTQEEQAFFNGPLAQLCRMLDDWAIHHESHDLTPKQWSFMRDNGFFALIIPKQYGGLAFSAHAHSEILARLSAVSVTAASTVAVPNSLGPAELLLHYGTEAQKDCYLPKLANGTEIPCFALTGPESGSDAASMPDHGIVCYADVAGEQQLCIKLTFSKRYITLAPVATLIGLAFKLYDPDHLLGPKTDVGITCALIPRETPGVNIGNRHFPLSPFQNGPIRGENVIVSIETIIGGQAMAGRGWHMLMDCLSVGRAVSLPSTTAGSTKHAVATTTAYARIRRQFGIPLTAFEAIEDKIAFMAAKLYAGEAIRSLSSLYVDKGIKPSVVSAIAKYHVTEIAREVGAYAMDIHAGKAICQGPANYISNVFVSSPIGITVEGANILTRSLIIYGQGAVRCHPYILDELDAITMEDKEAGLAHFDNAFLSHVGSAISNIASTFWLGLTNARWLKLDAPSETKRYYQILSRYSAALAFTSDMCMVILGGTLKRKEKLSARLGDLLSFLFICSAALKRYEDQGQAKEDLPLLRYVVKQHLLLFQNTLIEICDNLPNRLVGRIMRFICLPFGFTECGPRDELGHEITSRLIADTATRQRLLAGHPGAIMPDAHPLKQLDTAFHIVIAAEPAEKKLQQIIKQGTLKSLTYDEQIEEAQRLNLLDNDEIALIREARAARLQVIHVDEFTPEEVANHFTRKTPPLVCITTDQASG